MMERQFREDQIKWEAQQQKEGQLKVAVDRALQLKAAKHSEEALAALNDIKRTYAPEMVQKVASHDGRRHSGAGGADRAPSPSRSSRRPRSR